MNTESQLYWTVGEAPHTPPTPDRDTGQRPVFSAQYTTIDRDLLIERMREAAGRTQMTPPLRDLAAENEARVNEMRQQMELRYWQPASADPLGGIAYWTNAVAASFDQDGGMTCTAPSDPPYTTG